MICLLIALLSGYKRVALPPAKMIPFILKNLCDCKGTTKIAYMQVLSSFSPNKIQFYLIRAEDSGYACIRRCLFTLIRKAVRLAKNCSFLRICRRTRTYFRREPARREGACRRTTNYNPFKACRRTTIFSNMQDFYTFCALYLHISYFFCTFAAKIYSFSRKNTNTRVLYTLYIILTKKPAKNSA